MTLFLKRIFAPGGALFSSLAILLTVIVGAYISLHSTTITGELDSICLWRCDAQAFNKASFALVLLILLGAVLLAREIAVTVENNSARNALHNHIKSTPSKSFLGNYTAFMRILGGHRKKFKEELTVPRPNPATLHQLIRECLHGVLSLAKDWDGNAGKSSVYRANIMMMLPSDLFNPVSLSDDSLGNIVDILDSSTLFLYNASVLGKVAKCSGILVLEDTTLTVSTKVEFGEQDDFMKGPVCFAYAEQGNSGTITQPILPGAPTCASFGTAQYLHDTKYEIEKFLENLEYKNKEYCNRFKQDVLEYYNGIEEAQSILSIPIQYRRDTATEQLPSYQTIAVLNIYRNKKDIFRDEDSAMNFAQLMEPICYHFGKMLVSLTQLGPDAPSAT